MKIELYGPIFAGKSEEEIKGCVFGGDVAETIKNTDEDISIYINSPGGEVNGMMEISAALHEWRKNHPESLLEVTVESLAASAAGYLLLMLPEGAKIKAYPLSMIMYHGASLCIEGGAGAMEDAKRYLDGLDSTFKDALSKTGIPQEDIENCLKEGRQLWLTGSEAFDLGIVGELIDGEPEKISATPAPEYRAVALFYPEKTTKNKGKNMKKIPVTKAVKAEEIEVEKTEEIEEKKGLPIEEVKEEVKEEITEEKEEEITESFASASTPGDPELECGEIEAKADLEELIFDLEKRIKFLEDKLIEKDAEKEAESEKVKALSGGLMASAKIEKKESKETDFRSAFASYRKDHPELTVEDAFVASAKAFPELYKATIYERKYTRN